MKHLILPALLIPLPAHADELAHHGAGTLAVLTAGWLMASVIVAWVIFLRESVRVPPPTRAPSPM
jgi:hypothetical protein